MSRYTVKDKTGRTVTFDWNGTSPPTEADLEEVFKASESYSPQNINLGEMQTDLPVSPEESAGLVRGGLESGGLLFGGAIGTGAAGPAGGVAGAGLGYGIGRNLANRVDELYGVRKPETLGESFRSAGEDVVTGAAMEAGGLMAGKAIGYTASKVGKVGRQFIGRVTGAGEGAAEEAYTAGDAFTKAMRGKIKGDEVVEHAREALSVIKANRSSAYRTHLEKLSGKGPVDTSRVTSKAAELFDKYGVKVAEDGTLDFSRSKVGRRGVRDLKEMWKIIKNWGTKEGDNTPLGLDTLKQQLDDFYSESSKARGFVAELRNEIKQTIVKNVPEYAEMTKGYAETTRLIKDIESNLMMRKQGMSGRIVADQTLRRLLSSMRNNFVLRRELVEALGNQGGTDISGEVAGYAMSSAFPLGIAGTGPMMIGEAALAKLVSPSLWPVLAASSPRLSGEFLRMFGKFMMKTPGKSEVIGRGVAYGMGGGRK